MDFRALRLGYLMRQHPDDPLVQAAFETGDYTWVSMEPLWKSRLNRHFVNGRHYKPMRTGAVDAYR